jgi:thiopurine S-methyltransferase
VPRKSEQAFGTVYHHNTLRIICADIFTLDAQMLSAFTGVYDRAALIALPPDMRSRYATHIYGQLAPGYKGLLITLEYDQSKMQGPPFSVSNEQVQSIYGTHSTARLIDRRDIIEKEPKFKEKGLERLDTLVFELSGKASKP